MAVKQSNKDRADRIADDMIAIGDGTAPQNLLDKVQANASRIPSVLASPRLAAAVTLTASILSGTASASALDRVSVNEQYSRDIAGNVIAPEYDFEIRASRTTGVAPCTIVFAAEDFAANGFSRTTGSAWNFGDPGKGNFSFDDVASGTHSGSNGSSTLTTSENLVLNEWVGKDVFNLDDGCRGVVASNTAGANSILTFESLTGGTRNDFNTGDNFAVRFRDIADIETDKNIAINDLVTTHTFTEPGTYLVLCRLNDGVNPERLGYIFVTIESKLQFYGAPNFIAVSNTLDINADWSALGHDFPVPPGTPQVDSLAGVGFNNIANTTVVCFRSDDFSAEGDVLIPQGNNNFMIDHFGNASDPRPVLGRIFVGVREAESTQFATSDTQLDDAASTFGNLGWIETGTLANLRTPRVDMGMSFQHVDLYKLDMDYRPVASGGGEVGLRLGNWMNLVETTDLSANRCMFTKGFYMSECVIRASISNPPGYVFSALQDYSPTWVGIIGCVIEGGEQHNMRMHGAETYSITNNAILGNHQDSSKTNNTMRGNGYNQQTSELAGMNRAQPGTGMENITDNDAEWSPSSRWGCTSHNYLEPGLSISSLSISTSPTNDTNRELISDIVNTDNIFGAGPNMSIAYRIAVGGIRILITDNNYPSQIVNTGLVDFGGDRSLTNLADNNIVDGVVISTIPNWFTTNSDNLLDNRVSGNPNALPAATPP